MAQDTPTKDDPLDDLPPLTHYCRWFTDEKTGERWHIMMATPAYFQLPGADGVPPSADERNDP